jgi:hypothetical protein
MHNKPLQKLNKIIQVAEVVADLEVVEDLVRVVEEVGFA